MFKDLPSSRGRYGSRSTYNGWDDIIYYGLQDLPKICYFQLLSLDQQFMLLSKWIYFPSSP